MSHAGTMARRALAQNLSRIARASVSESLHYLRTAGPSRAARRIGFTGPPGAGKSTLVGRLAKLRVEHHAPLAIIAIDPSSPRTTGALLGDRIRMDALLAGADVYIRSLPSGWAADGLSDNLADVLAAVEAHAFAEILLETVGVGQVEYGARVLVDTLVLTLAPNSGDQVQAMKAGVIETADIVVVNKADQPGAERMAQDLRNVLAHDMRRLRKPPPVLLTAANDVASLVALSDAIDEHARWRSEHVARHDATQARTLFHVRSLLNRRVAELIGNLPADAQSLPAAELYALVIRRLTETN